MAGLVGIGLSRLFSGSKLESAEVGKDERLANNMGLFLQKTNIIRDYLDDVQQGREFWPKEVTFINARLRAPCSQNWSDLFIFVCFVCLFVYTNPY